MNPPRIIFVDADVFVALAREDDTNHVRAVKALDKLVAEGVLFRTSNYVFLEAVTVISQRVGHEAAVSFIQEIISPTSSFPLVWVTEEMHARAIGIFSEQRSKNVSFVDCANMALVRQEGMDAIFSFDVVYGKNEFEVVGKSAESRV